MDVNNAPTKKMFDMKYFSKGLIVILENAYIESAKIGTEYKLLNCDDHSGFLMKKKRDPAQARPDIAHQCLMSLLDSPLNKAGLLKIYVHTANNVVIDINPKLRIPRTFKRFSGLMVQLLHKLSIKAEGTRGEPVLRLVKGPVTKYFPTNATVIGTSFSSENLIDIMDFVPTLFAKNEDEGSDEPNLKKVKVEQVDSDDEIKQEESESEEEEGVKEEENEGSSDEDEEEGEKVKEEEVEEPPMNFEVEEGFTFTNGIKKEDKVIVFVIGAMSHGKVSVEYTNKEVSISSYPLSGSVACCKICSAFEKFFGVL